MRSGPGGAVGAGALSGGLPERAFSPEEAAALRQKLWPLLARQAGLYTGCGSSSLPEDTARELLCSLCYTLKVWFQAGGAASQPLADADLEAGLRQGQAILEQKCRQARRLWMAVRHSAPDLKNRALADTLDSIGAFSSGMIFAFSPIASPVISTTRSAVPSRKRCRAWTISSLTWIGWAWSTPCCVPLPPPGSAACWRPAAPIPSDCWSTSVSRCSPMPWG